MGYAKDYLKAYVVTGGKGGASALYAIEQAKQRKKLEELQKQQQNKTIQQPKKYDATRERSAWIWVCCVYAMIAGIAYWIYNSILG